MSVVGQFKENWKKLSPRVQRIAAVGGSIAAVAALILVFLPGGQESAHTAKKDKDVIRNIITDANTRRVGIDSLNADLQLEHRDLNDTKKKLDAMQAQLAEDKKQQEQFITGEFKQLHQEIAAARANSARAGFSPGTGAPAAGPVSGNPFDFSPLMEDAGGRGGPGAAVGGVAVRVISGDNEPAGSAATAGAGGTPGKHDALEHGMYLPPGSLLSGVIVTGVDAPTAQGARREPFPVMIRLNKEAVLPNDYYADVRECFVLLGVYGDLSSERMYGRGENISCVRNDGKVIDAKIDGFLSGEDGKNGVRGRLITRDGPMLVRAAFAGFLQGWANALGGAPVPVVATTPASSVQYQNFMSSDALRAATAAGAGKAFDKLADYYLKLADATQPIIEVDAGREVNIVLTGSLQLKLRE